jgi:hypothetical protein
MKKSALIVRLLSILALLVILITTYMLGIRPAQLRWGSSGDEVRLAIPGDELVIHPTFVATRAITIRARPEDIWPWLVQMGYNRAGFYGYDLIENLGSISGIHSAESIVPELQHPKTGDVLPISSVAHLTFGTIRPNEYLIWQSEAVPHDGAFTWALYPVDASHTRLVSRIRLRYHWAGRGLALDLFTEFADHVAVPKILEGVRDRVEGKVQESLGRETTEIAIWISALAEFATSFGFVFRWRRWGRAWCLALGTGFLLMFVLYAHAPFWFSAGLVWAVALPMFLSSRKTPAHSFRA